MMNTLRLSGGFATELFHQRTGLPLISIEKSVNKAIQLGLITHQHSRIEPTLKGRRFLNNLLEIFLDH